MQKQVSLRNTIGKGRDTQWRNPNFTYNHLVVEKVYRIEHTERWRMFRNRRQVRSYILLNSSRRHSLINALQLAHHLLPLDLHWPQKLRECASHMHSITPHVPTYLEGNMDWMCDPNDPLDHSVNEANAG